MQLYHGTSRKNLAGIRSDGLQAPSYWGTKTQATEYARQFGKNGIILVADIDEDHLSASLLMAHALYDEGEIDEIPDENDLDFSLQYLGGATCNATITEFEVIKPRHHVNHSPSPI